MQHTKKILAMLLCLTAMSFISSCSKDNGNTATGSSSEQTQDYYLFPNFEKLLCYIGRSDTSALIASFRNAGYEITTTGYNAIYASETYDSEGVGKYTFICVNNMVFHAGYQYNKSIDTNPIDLKEGFLYVFNDAINTFKGMYLYNCYCSVDGSSRYYNSPKEFLNSLGNKNFKNASITIRYGSNREYMVKIEVNTNDNIAYYVNYNS